MSIIDALVQGGLTFVRGILGLMPAYSLPASMEGWGASIGNALAGANSVFPVATLGACIVVAVAVRLWLMVIDLLVYVYQLIPFKAS